MNKSCFVCPIHRPKFYLGLAMIQSYNRYFNDDHLYLVFSSEEESSEFKTIANNLRYRSIICNEVLGKSPITQKKYFGLMHVYEHTEFEYCAAIDCDSLFFKSIDYNHLFEQYYVNCKLYGNGEFYHTPQFLLLSPAKFFSAADQSKIYQATCGFKSYFWFNEIPLYRKDHFYNFLSYINYAQVKNTFEYIDFDFITYGYYLLAKDIFTLNPIVVNGLHYQNVLIEGQPSSKPADFKQAFTYCNPMWIKTPIEQEHMKNTFICVHADDVVHIPKVIANKGLLEGPNPNLENNPFYVQTALDKTYSCKVDVWLVNNKWYLGQYTPQYEVPLQFLLQPKLWLQARNTPALYELLSKKDCKVFWNQTDDYAIASNGVVWASPGNISSSPNTVILLPEHVDPLFNNLQKPVQAYCTEYPIAIQSKL